MIAISLRDVAAAVQGTLTGGADPDTMITGSVEFDSRRIAPGGLFVALVGDHSDGHQFTAGAVSAGAVAVLAAHPVAAPAVLVEDVLHALGLLAHEVLTRAPDVVVVGITGSSGKTSTKDLLAQVLAPTAPTVAPAGSFNNELGHPYTVLQITAATRYLILENSARGVGHIAALCRIARPRIGAVLNVGSAHLGEFGSRAAIAASKAELVEALPGAVDGGVAVLNADDPLVLGMAGRTAARVVTVGISPEADIRASAVTLDELGRASFTLQAGTASAAVRLGLHGAHHVPNALAVAAVSLELGLGLADIATRLSAARAVSRWRMEVTERPDGVLLVNDAYNANPESMRAAVRSLQAMSAGRRSWAVLGPMGELGPDSTAEHEALGQFVAAHGIDRLVTVGELAAGVHAGASRDWSKGDVPVLVADAHDALALLRRELRGPDVVLVKASRSVGLERLAASLLEPVVDGRPA